MMLQDKHITFIGLNFAPEDTAIGLYSTQMVDALIDAGAHVTVVTAFPYYPKWQIDPDYQDKPAFVEERYRTAVVYRFKQYVPAVPTFKKRVRHILSFTRGTYRNLNRIKKADLVISVIPFTASAWLGSRFARKHGIPHWIHIQDFEFDAALQSGLSAGSFVFDQLFKQESSILNSASTVSTISHNMMARLGKKSSSRSYYLPNWIDGDQINPRLARQHHLMRDSRFKILYSGNVGDKQDWEYFSAFAKALPSTHYQITIVGAGSRYQQLKSDHDQENIVFHDPVPLEELSDLLCSTDAHFLFQKTDVLDTVMPSKLLGMMASGKPSLVLGNPSSEVKTVMQQSGAGIYLEKPDVAAGVHAMEEWKKKSIVEVEPVSRARTYVLENYSKTPLLEEWIQELSKLVQ
ncbi:MAG: glycosyltransferase [Nonlabens sp.]